jgi:hypothetical protein
MITHGVHTEHIEEPVLGLGINPAAAQLNWLQRCALGLQHVLAHAPETCVSHVRPLADMLRARLLVTQLTAEHHSWDGGGGGGGAPLLQHWLWMRYGLCE